MKTLTRLSHYALLSVCFFSLASPLAGTIARADDLVSLDDPAPTTVSPAGNAGANANTSPSVNPAATKAPAMESLDSLDGSSAAGGAEVALDLGAEENSFNPYLFSRSTVWGLLPLLSLILLGLHLIPVPKRAVVQKIDQAQRFFRVNDQDKTGMVQRPTASQLAGAAAPVTENTSAGEAKTRVFIPPGKSKIFVPKGEED